MNSKNKDIQAAFKLFAKGTPQKVIALELGYTEKSISSWKLKYKWAEKLQVQQQTKIPEAYLVVSKYIGQSIQTQTGAGQMLKDTADDLNQALTTLHQVLSENYLI